MIGARAVPPLVLILLSVALCIEAQEQQKVIAAYGLPELLFYFNTSDLVDVIRGAWSTEDLLAAGEWKDADIVTGEELDQAGIYWKYYRLPPLTDFYEEEYIFITRPVFIVETYETEVRLYYRGTALIPTGAPTPNRISYQYYHIENYVVGDYLFFQVESNPYAGEEIYFSDSTIMERDVGRIWLLHFYGEFPTLVFAIITIFIGTAMFAVFGVRFRRREWSLFWFGVFSLSFAVYSLFDSSAVNVFFSVEPKVDFYLAQLFRDLLPISLMLFYLRYMSDGWRGFFRVLIAGQIAVLTLHLVIMTTGLFSEWSDFLSLIFPLLMYASVIVHVAARHRKNQFAAFFSAAFLILGLTYLLQLTGELFDLFANAPLFVGPMLFYAILCSLPVFSYFRQESHIREQNVVFSRFVPQEFLGFLQKEEITEIHLGDQIEREITILFADIRSFTSISERMTPEENFEFLNQFLGSIGPVVREYDGFIDKYIGDAIMALFPGRPDDAVHAAIRMQVKVGQMNFESAGPAQIRLGIGIHTGRTMLGIIGEEERYQGTVISDAVNLASRLESLTKRVGHSVILSEATVVRLRDKIGVRLLGSARVRGKEERTKVFTLD